MNKLLKTAYCFAFLSATFCAGAQLRARKPVKRILSATEVETTAGKWRFFLYPYNFIKATFTPIGSERNEQVSDAMIAKPVSQPSSAQFH